MTCVSRYGLAPAWLAFASACSGGATASEASGQHATAEAGVVATAAIAGAGASAGHTSLENGAGGDSPPDVSARGGGAAGAGIKPSSGSNAVGSMAGGRAAPASAAGRGGSDVAGTPAAEAASTPDGKLYSDDFEDGNLTMPSWIDAEPELGGKWQVVAADGGKALAQTASVSDWVIAAGGDYRWTDQVVEARVKVTSEPGKAGIFARLGDTRNYYFLYLDGGSNLVLRKRIDNSSSDIQKVKVETVADTWYTLKLSVVGDALTGYLDGDMLVSGSDSGVSSGGIGVGTADCTAQFDDISVHGS